MGEENGEAGQVYVRFGPRDNQVIPLPWAESILTQLAGVDPNRFGRLLQAAALGAPK